MPESSTSVDRDQAVSILLGELSSVRAEQLGRLGAQQQLIVAGSTVSAIVLGFVFGSNASPRVLFVLPVAVAILGLVHNDHARYIGWFGMYVGQELWPALRELSRHDGRADRPDQLPTYEDLFYDVLWSPDSPRYMREQVPSALGPPALFVVIPLVTLAGLVIHGDVAGVWYWLLWSFEVALIGFEVWMMAFVGTQVYGVDLKELKGNVPAAKRRAQAARERRRVQSARDREAGASSAGACEASDGSP